MDQAAPLGSVDLPPALILDVLGGGDAEHSPHQEAEGACRPVLDPGGGLGWAGQAAGDERQARDPGDVAIELGQPVGASGPHRLQGPAEGQVLSPRQRGAREVDARAVCCRRLLLAPLGDVERRPTPGRGRSHPVETGMGDRPGTHGGGRQREPVADEQLQQPWRRVDGATLGVGGRCAHHHLAPIPGGEGGQPVAAGLGLLLSPPLEGVAGEQGVHGQRPREGTLHRAQDVDGVEVHAEE